MVYVFGNFEWHEQTSELRRDGKPFDIQDQPLKLLLCFIKRLKPNELVSNHELLKEVWRSDTPMNTLHSAVRRLRQILGNNEADERIIKSVRSYGYRFIPQVKIHLNDDHHTDGPGGDETWHHAPFIAGPPILHPRKFFGRERILKRLFGLWKRLPLQHAAIIGPRRSGKTSLLRYLENITTTPPEQLRPGQYAAWLSEPQRYRWIFVDFQEPRMGCREELLRYLLGHLSLPTPDPCDLESFSDAVSHGLRAPTVVLLDEIGVALQRYPDLDDVFWESLRALAANQQVQGKLAFVVAARESPMQLADHTAHTSSFFNIFPYVAELGPLTTEEAHELIASSPIPFPKADRDWILAQSGCWPLLVQILCHNRLLALENGESDDAWRADGLRDIAQFKHLLESR